MKRILPALTSLLLIISTTAFAGHHSRYYDYGRVIKVTPVYHGGHGYHSHSHYQCRKKYRRTQHHYQGHRSDASTITGAVLGGVVGNTLGKNSKNRGIATVAGALVGGVIGHEVGRDSDPHVRHYNDGYSDDYYYVNSHDSHVREYDERCYDNVHHSRYSKKLKGYEVTYRYKGERFTTFTRQHPGNRIRLEVNLSPTMYKRK